MRHQVTLIMFACLPIALLQMPVQVKQADESDKIVFHETGEPVRLQGIAPGVRLYADYVWPKAYVEASRDRIVLARHGRKQIVWNLNQLRGCIRVESKKDALRFVRLRTTPQTFYFFPPEEVDIIPRRDLARIPDYGVDSSWHWKPVPTGSLGVLSNREYRIGRFTPPRVREIAEGFVINRWTYTNQEGICYVQEFVGKDGGYARRVLKKRQVKLRRMYWPIPEAAGEE